MSYYYARTVDLPFEQAIDRVTEALKAEGFGVLSVWRKNPILG